MKTPPGSTKLPIRARRTLEQEGLRTFDETAYCESRHRSLPIEDCVACTHCTHVTFSTAGGSYLICDQPPKPTSARAEPVVADLMTRVVQCVRPETSVEAAAALLLECNIGGAPVIDPEGHAIGVVSKTDLVRCLHERLDPKTTTVGEIMMPMVFALREDASLDRAAALMATEGVHRIPIVAADGVLVGVLTPLDLTRALARSAGAIP